MKNKLFIRISASRSKNSKVLLVIKPTFMKIFPRHFNPDGETHLYPSTVSKVPFIILVTRP